MFLLMLDFKTQRHGHAGVSPPLPTAKVPASTITADGKLKCNTFLSFFALYAHGFFFCDSGQQEGATTFEQHRTAPKVLWCNNYKRYRNSCQLLSNGMRHAQEKTFLASFCSRKDCASMNVLLCSAVRREGNKGMNFHSLKGQHHILVWS